MEMKELPEVNPPSGRVPGQGLLAAPILKSRRRRNRGEIAKKGSALDGFGRRGKYMPKGGQGVDPGVQVPPCAAPLWRATRATAPLVVPLRSHFGDSGRFLHADFLYIFPRIYWAL